jgi:hypothetical protein
VVRYRDRRQERPIQRSIYVGDAELANKARALIRRWRAEALTPDDLRRQQLLAMASFLARGRLRAAAAAVAADPREALEFVARMGRDDGEFQFGKRGGRPRRSGLW